MIHAEWNVERMLNGRLVGGGGVSWGGGSENIPYDSIVAYLGMCNLYMDPPFRNH